MSWRASHCAAALLLTLPGCGAATSQNAMETGRMADGWSKEDGAAALKRIGLKLPPSAHIDSAGGEYGMDDALRLIVTMPAADWAAFEPTLRSSDGRAPRFQRENNVLLGPDDPAWAPGEAPGLTTAQLLWNGGTEGLNLGVTSERAGKVQLFIFWNQT